MIINQPISKSIVFVSFLISILLGIFFGNLLKKYLIKIYRTDQNGTIEISSDGENYSAKTFK